MKVTVQNKKDLEKDIKVLIEKKTISKYLDEKYEEIKKSVVLKGFRPGKVPREVIKKQFGKALYGEVIEKILKETSAQALKDKNIKPAGQPKIDLKSYGEDKDLEYIISVTELPKVKIESIEKIKFDDYTIKINSDEVEKRIKDIAKSQKNFKESKVKKISKEGDLVIFDYTATVNGKDFKGNQGKNTQIVLGKDLFIKGFDKQLINLKKGDQKNVEVTLPENFPGKEVANKKAVFKCKIVSLKEPQETIVDDNFAKNLGAQDLNDLKNLISNQINQEYKNSLNSISNKQILKQIENFDVEKIPQNLLDEEIKFLSHSLKEDEAKEKKKDFEKQAIKRIKTGLILNEFGEKNNIQITDQELQNEIQKQLKMMPGQEKIVKEYYEKNPTALNSLKGTLYEEKIIKEIKSKAISNKKEISKLEADKILKEENEKNLKETHKEQKSSAKKKNETQIKKTKKNTLKSSKTQPKLKKVSKK